VPDLNRRRARSRHWIDQSFRYAQHLRRHGGDPGVLVVPGRHHFDILDLVCDEASTLRRIMRGGAWG
jgi:arylformamidase